MRERLLETRFISCFSESTGTFALGDESGSCGFVASVHRELSQESVAWLRKFLTECFAAARVTDRAGDDPDMLVRFFQAVHAGLFGEKQGAAQEVGEVSLAAARVTGDLIEVAGAGRCAAYRVTACNAGRVLSAEEGGDQSGLGTSLKVSMEMVKRSVSDDAVYVLTSARVDAGDAWDESLRHAIGAAAGNATEGCTVLFGEVGGALVVVGSETAVKAVAGPETRPEATGVAWYTSLREEIKKGAGALFREDRREDRQAKVPGAEAETETAAETAAELEPPARSVVPAAAEAAVGSRVETTAEPEARPEPEPRERVEEAEKEPRDEAVAATVGSAISPEFLGGAPLLEPVPPKVTRRTIAVPVRSLGLVIVAVAVCAGAYGLWARHSRPLRLFSWVSGRDRKMAASAANDAGGALVLGSVPSGAEVFIDNRVISGHTPVATVGVSSGTHEVKLRLGELGEWSGSVSLQPGDTANVNVAFVGGISVSSGAKQGLSVFLDDQPRGYTPCLLESIPAGLHVVRVEGEGFSPWQEEVVVSYGGISEVEVKPGKLPATGQVRVTSRLMGEEGFEDRGGAAVFVDGKRAGSTPAKIDTKPGLHSIKVGGLQGHSPSVFVIDVRPGGKHFIRADFGGGEPIVIDCLETRAPGGELMVYATLVNKREAVLSDVSLYLEKSGGVQVRWQPMVLVPGSRGVYASVIPESILTGEGVLKYFARARTSEGIEYYSEVRTAP
jgi:hypothetical protein